MIDGYCPRTTHTKREVSLIVRAAAPAAVTIREGMGGAIGSVVVGIARGKRGPGLFLTVIQKSQSVDVPGPTTFRARRVDAPLPGVVNLFGAVEDRLFTVVGV